MKKSTIKLQYLPFSKLVFLSDNPRTRTDSGFAKMVEDIKADPSFYENRPTLVNMVNGEFRVYAGDLRAHAAHDGLGWSEIPCNVEADVPDAVMRRRAILDNTHREQWDADALDKWEFERDELEDMGVNVDWVSEDEDEAESVNYSEKNKEIDVNKFEDIMTLNLQYSSDEYWKVREQMAAIAQTPEAALWKLLGNE